MILFKDEDAADSSETLEGRSMSHYRKGGTYVSFLLLLSSPLIPLLGQANNYIYYYCYLYVITVLLCTLGVHLISLRGVAKKSATRHACVNVNTLSSSKNSPQGKPSFSFSSYSRRYCTRHSRSRSGKSSSSPSAYSAQIERDDDATSSSSSFSFSVPIRRSSPRRGPVIIASRPQRPQGLATSVVFVEQPLSSSSDDLSSHQFEHCLHDITNASSCGILHHFLRKEDHRRCGVVRPGDDTLSTTLQRITRTEATPAAAPLLSGAAEAARAREEGESPHPYHPTADAGIFRNIMRTRDLLLVHEDFQLKNDQTNGIMHMILMMMNMPAIFFTFTSSSLST